MSVPPNSNKPRFVCEMELGTSSHDRRVLRVRMDCADLIFNAVTCHLLRRLNHARRDPDWQKARELPSGKERTGAFRKIRRRYGLSEYAAHKHPSLRRECWLRGHLDSNTAQKVATEAWKALEQHMYGRRGRPRPRRRGTYASVEGKKASVGIRLVEHEGSYAVAWDSRRHKLLLPLRFDTADPVHCHAMEHRLAYVRIVRRLIRGKERYFAQLVLRGTPLAWHERKEGRFEPQDAEQGLDVGPSTIAQVTGTGEANYFRLCEGIDRKERARRRYQRRMDRQRRANNPERFRPNGTVKPSRERWKRSKRERRTIRARAEMDRKLAAHRRTGHGRLSNEIVSAGKHIRTEAISHKAFQRAFGRSVGHRAPGLLMKMVERKTLLVGGSWMKVPTRTTYLSQRCVCGARKKKDLSCRRHICGCQWVPDGTFADRDLFSAFLALFCDREGNFDKDRARDAWHAWGANCLLRPLSRERSFLEQPRSSDSQSSLAEKRTWTTGDACPPKGRIRKARGWRRSTRRGRRWGVSGTTRNPPRLRVGNS